MEITPDTAFASAQIIALLLVATLLDPWAKTALAKDKTSAGHAGSGRS